MAGSFDPSKLLSGLSNFSNPSSYNIPAPIMPDKRTRAEVREDFEKELESLDFAVIEELKEKLLDAHDPKEVFSLKEDLENSLVKFLRFYYKFEDLNSEESRKLALKEKELSLEAKHDWKEKFRLFFFRILASFLLVVTLFAIGYIEHEYEWARLPMSKYLDPTKKLP
jgi:hypothetical protein